MKQNRKQKEKNQNKKRREKNPSHLGRPEAPAQQPPSQPAAQEGYRTGTLSFPFFLAARWTPPVSSTFNL
jgi:hypothetical protein